MSSKSPPYGHGVHVVTDSERLDKIIKLLERMLEQNESKIMKSWGKHVEKT